MGNRELRHYKHWRVRSELRGQHRSPPSGIEPAFLRCCCRIAAGFLWPEGTCSHPSGADVPLELWHYLSGRCVQIGTEYRYIKLSSSQRTPHVGGDERRRTFWQRTYTVIYEVGKRQLYSYSLSRRTRGDKHHACMAATNL